MTMKSGHPDDPRALVAEAYAIDGLGPEDARTIFLDWALGLPDGTEPAGAAARLLAHHAGAPEDHPMTRLLREAEAGAARPAGRRGARRRRAG